MPSEHSHSRIGASRLGTAHYGFSKETTAEKRLRNRALEGNTAAIRLLVESGAHVDACNEHGRTALHCAAERGHTFAIRTLLELGADIHAVDKDGRTPLEVAAMHGQGHALSHSELWPAGRTDLPASSTACIGVAPRSAVHWADINQRRLRNRALSGDIAGVKELLAIGVDVISTNEVCAVAATFNALSCTCLAATRACLLPEVTSSLLPNPWQDGKSAIDIASDAGHHAVAKLLHEAALLQRPELRPNCANDETQAEVRPEPLRKFVHADILSNSSTTEGEALPHSPVRGG